MHDLDVVIVGAGAAGLAAGARLRDAGVRFVLLEAKDRPGGRAWTDTRTFGVPFDHGCHWLHSASLNPFKGMADRLGHRYQVMARSPIWRLHLGARWATDEEAREAFDAVARTWVRADEATAAGDDVAFDTLLGEAGAWSGLVAHWVGMMTSLPPHEVSAKDYASYHDTGENWPVTDGYGALVVRSAGTLPVRTGVAVTGIEAERNSVRVETDHGSLTAKAIIVTVSLAVLASGRISFRPQLGETHMRALESVRLGHAEKVAIAFDRDVFGVPDTTYFQFYGMEGSGPGPMNFQLRPFGHEMAIGHIAGEEVAEAKTTGDMEAHAIDLLAQAFGSELRRRVTRVVSTNWSGDPFIRGAYSGTLPGKSDRRADLRTPLGERIFYAGEATSLDAFSTCHGAHIEGGRAADLALARVAAPPKGAPAQEEGTSRRR